MILSTTGRKHCSTARQWGTIVPMPLGIENEYGSSDNQKGASNLFSLSDKDFKEEIWRKTFSWNSKKAWIELENKTHK